VYRSPDDRDGIVATVRSVLVCETQVPFVDGGAERLVRGLVGELRRHGYRAEAVSIPFKSYPKGELLAQAALWRLVDLSESNYEKVDAVITTKFPNYFVRHPNKVTWLLHQYRAIYDLCGTPLSDFTDAEADVRLRDRLIGLDTEVLAESKRLFSISQTTTARLAKYNGLAAEPLYHPPLLAGALEAGPFSDYVLSVGRLEHNKRVDLVVRPLDEDYGYVTLEAFLARKPVVTTTDAGGPLEFVDDGVNGLVADPAPEAIAAAIARLAADRSLARRLGEAGFERARTITWDGVVDRLVGQVG